MSLSRFHKQYYNNNFCINFSTNNKDIYSLVENYLDLKDDRPRSKLVNIDINIESVNKTKAVPTTTRKSNLEYVSAEGLKCAKYSNVTIDHKIKKITSLLSDFKQKDKEHILYHTFFKPLKLLLLKMDYHSIHSSIVTKDNCCIFICGPQNTGKSTTAFLFTKLGYGIVCDDDCFIKAKKDNVILSPLPTKMGVKDSILKRYPLISSMLVKDYKYGGKRRASLSNFYKTVKSDFKTKVILMPRYSETEKFSIKKAPRKWVLCKLFNENFNDEGQQNKETFSKAFLSYFALVKDAKCFEIIYNDKTITKIPSAVERQINQ
ncbi:MAG: hypothetical protein KBC84_01480 [Proteobacteria bacterium]|nr:hypothetical protein [Pseudomonadota bacterium]